MKAFYTVFAVVILHSVCIYISPKHDEEIPQITLLLSPFLQTSACKSQKMILGNVASY